MSNRRVTTLPSRSAQMNIEMDAGVTFAPAPFIWVTKTSTTRTPVNLEGCSAVFRICDSDTLEEIHTASTENGEITLGTTNGQIAVVIPDSVTSTFTFTTAGYDLEVVMSDEKIFRILRGIITLIPDPAPVLVV